MKNLISFKYILIVFILFAVYALSPVEMATKVDLLDSKKDYLICEISTATEIDYKILYDSKDRGVDFVRVNDRKLNANNNKKEIFNPTYTKNKYVLFPNDFYVDYKNNCMVFNGKYDRNIAYPINRETFVNNILPKSWLCQFETW